MKILLALTLLLGWMAPTHAANEFTGNNLQIACRSFVAMVYGTGQVSDDGYDAGVCMGFLAGFPAGQEIQNYVGAGYKSTALNRGYCVPEAANKGQIAQVLVKYLNAHPEKLHYQPGVLMYLALAEAFPCKST